MKSLNAWISGFAIGALEVVLLGVMPIVGFALVLATLALALLYRGAPSLSGFLVGLGAIWLLLIARQDLSGGQMDNALGWELLGAVPLAIGVVLGLASVVGAGRVGGGAGPSSDSRS